MPFCPTLSLQKVSGSDMIELESWFLFKASPKLGFTVTTHSMSSCVFWLSCRHHVCTQVLFYCSIPTFYSWGWWQKPALATIQSKSLYVKCAYGSLTNDLKSLDSVVCVHFEKTFSNFVLVRKSFHQFRAKVVRASTSMDHHCCNAAHASPASQPAPAIQTIDSVTRHDRTCGLKPH